MCFLKTDLIRFYFFKICDILIVEWVHSFNGKTSVSKTEIPGSSPGGPATDLYYTK